MEVCHEVLSSGTNLALLQQDVTKSKLSHKSKIKGSKSLGVKGAKNLEGPKPLKRTSSGAGEKSVALGSEEFREDGRDYPRNELNTPSWMGHVV